MGGVVRTACCLVWDSAPRDYAAAKWVYCACFTLTAIITWLLRDYADDWFLAHSAAFSYCAADSAYAQLCSGKQVAIRVSFANVSFFGAHALALLWCKTARDPRTALHTSFWGVRLLVWAGAILGFFFVPASVMAVYGQVARAGAAVFLVLIMLEMVTWFYDINTWLVERDSRAAWTALMLGAVVSFAGGLALIGYAFWEYAPSSNCSLNIFFATWSLITGFALIAVLFVPRRLDDAGLLTSGAVFLYGSYLLVSALGSEPAGGGCSRGGSSEAWITVVGFFLAIFAVCYSTLNLGTSHIFGAGHADDGIGGNAPALDDDDALPYRADAFHLSYCLASMYMAMLFTNWQVFTSTSAFELSKGWASTWAKIGSKWFCEALYCWTVVAPAVLRNRDFS